MMCQKTSRDDVGQVSAIGAGRLAALGEMDLEEAAVAAPQVDERIKGLDDACAGCPAAANPRRQRHDGDPPIAQRLGAHAAGTRRLSRNKFDDVLVSNVLDVRINRQAVMGEANPTRAQLSPELFMLDR